MAAQGDARNARSLLLEALDKTRFFIERYSPDPLWVLVSGGKDSAAVWGLAARATTGYVAVYIQIPGQSHADNVEAVHRLAGILGVRERRVVVVKETRRIRDRLQETVETCSVPCLLHVIPYTSRGEDFWAAMRRYGYPAPLGRFGRGTRWCCGTFKHRVLQRLPYNGTRAGLPWKYGVDGVKATDSPYRARRYTADIITWPRTRDTYLFPLRTMNDTEVWNLLEHMGLREAVEQQYRRWGRSPNCMFCPMIGSKSLIERTVEAMPEGARRLLRETLEQLLPRYKPTTFSHKSITKWLQALDRVEATTPPTAAAPAGEAEAAT